MTIYKLPDSPSFKDEEGNLRACIHYHWNLKELFPNAVSGDVFETPVLEPNKVAPGFIKMFVRKQCDTVRYSVLASKDGQKWGKWHISYPDESVTTEEWEEIKHDRDIVFIKLELELDFDMAELADNEYCNLHVMFIHPHSEDIPSA